MKHATKPKAPPAPKPIGGLMDPRFRYTPSAATDVRKTFERVRAERESKARQL